MHSKTTTISPAAGPLIVTWLPLINEATIPPMMADSKPAVGGAPEATLIPMDSGSAIRKTVNPEIKLVFKFQLFSEFIKRPQS